MKYADENSDFLFIGSDLFVSVSVDVFDAKLNYS